MDLTVVVLIVAVIVVIPIFKTKAALVLAYVLSGMFLIYGLATIIANLLEPNHLSGLAYIIGSLFILLATGLSLLSRKLYKNKLKRLAESQL